MLNRRLASLLAAVTVAGLAATGCAEQSAAVRVDDATVSRSDFEDQLDLFYENDALRSAVFQSDIDRAQLRGEAAASYTQPYAAAIAGLNIEFLLTSAVLDDEGIELTDDHRTAAERFVEDEFAIEADTLPDDFRDRLIDQAAAVQLLQEELGGQGFNDAMVARYEAADIDVSSQYGTWDPNQFTVTSPSGPAPAPGTAGGMPELTTG